MPNIHVMDVHLSNQIAAGEVVDRPASIVKELVENAIDASATRIEIGIEEGGLQSIMVADNGDGMDREDSLLAFERHATSKLTSNKDLFRIFTLGFRGEALPSMASISRVELSTWSDEEPAGSKVIVKGGQVESVEDAPMRKGTIIKVSDLFYNTPARFKHLKSVHTELAHITDYLNRLALAYPVISFSLQHHDRMLLKTSGNGKVLDVIAAIYGFHMAKKMIPFEAKHLDFNVTGFLGRPDVNRSNRMHMTVLINGRYVKHPGITQTIMRAYHTLLPLHRFPVIVLSITMDPVLLDVNVHPAKLYVKISKEKELFEWLSNEMKQSMAKEQLIPEPLQEQHMKKWEKSSQVQLDLRLPHHEPDTDQPDSADREYRSYANEVQTYDSTKGSPAVEQIREKSTNIQEADEQVQEEPALVRARIPLLFPLAQVHGTYILAQNENGLYLIDQHAAQERIWYERFRQKLKNPDQDMQELAIPIVLEMSSTDSDAMQDHQELFEKIGLYFDEFGHHAYRVRAHPVWFPKGEEESFIREIIDYVFDHHTMDWSDFRDEVAMMMACRGSIKGNEYLSKPGMEALLEELRITSNPFTCPHGRPITVLFTKYDIDKMFKRISS